jgi:hypothetical protein
MLLLYFFVPFVLFVVQIAFCSGVVLSPPELVRSFDGEMNHAPFGNGLTDEL